jgi:hypothetical protein
VQETGPIGYCPIEEDFPDAGLLSHDLFAKFEAMGSEYIKMPNLRTCEAGEAFRFEVLEPYTDELSTDLYHGRQGDWLMQLIEILDQAGCHVRTMYREHTGNIICQDGVHRIDYASKRYRRKEAMGFMADGLNLDPDELMSGRFSKLIQALSFLLNFNSSIAISSIKDGKAWAAEISKADGKLILEGQYLSAHSSEFHGTMIIADKLYWRVARDWRAAPALNLSMNRDYPSATCVPTRPPAIADGQTQLAVSYPEPVSNRLHAIPVYGGTVECLNLDDHPKINPWNSYLGEKYQVGEPTWYLYIDGKRKYIGGFSIPERIIGLTSKCLMTWNLKGFQLEKQDDVFHKEQRNEIVLAVQNALRRITDPTMIRILIERMVRIKRHQNDNDFRLLEFVNLPDTLRARVAQISDETARSMQEVWRSLFDNMRISSDRDEIIAFKAQYSDDDPSGTQVIEDCKPIPNCGYTADKPSRLKRLRKKGTEVLRVIFVEPDVYAFLSEAGIPTVAQALQGDLMRVETPAITASVGSTLAHTQDLLSGTGHERQYVVFELPEGASAHAAISVADHMAQLTGGRVSALAIPEDSAHRLLFDATNPNIQIGDASRVVSKKPAFTIGGSRRPLLIRASEVTAEVADTPQQGFTPYTKAKLDKDEQLDPNYLLDREGIDVSKSHMPIAYYLTHLGSKFSVNQYGRSEWTADETWEELEIQNSEPSEFDTRIVMPKLNGEHRLLVREGDEIIAYHVEGGSVQFYREPDTGLYRVEGDATGFTYWTARELNTVNRQRTPLDQESDPIIELNTLSAEARSWIEPLLVPGINSVQRAQMIKQAWADHFVYDSTRVCRGNDEADYMRNLLENPTGSCSEAGEGLALLHRLAGNPSHVLRGYWHADDHEMGSHRWGEAHCGGNWMKFDGVTGARVAFSSFKKQAMPHLAQPNTDQPEEKPNIDWEHMKSDLGRLARHRYTAKAAIFAVAAALFGAGMYVESTYQVLGRNKVETVDTPDCTK